jgi:uncharacterized protein (DUF488 family)
MSANRLFSIGYASKPIEVFLAQLNQHGVNAIADVRSVPYSKVFYDYHREALITTLKNAGVHYVYLGEELGPRSKDDTHYNEQQQVQFDRLMQSSLYLDGVARLQAGLDKGLNVALMCAEKDPADCHRSLLIGYHLQRQLGMSLQHIKHDGRLETQQAMETRLVAMHDKEADLFSDAKEQIELAYQLQLRLKAYKRP